MANERFGNYLLLVVITAALSGCQQESEVRWGYASTDPGSSFAQLLTAPKQENLSSFATVEDLTEAVKTRTVTFAILEQPPQPVDGLSVVAAIFPSVLYILVKRSLHNCAQPTPLPELLSGKSIYAGSTGSSGHTLLQQLHEAQWLDNMSQLTLIKDPFAANPDIYFQFGGLLPVDAVRRLNDYCLASIGDSSLMGNGSWADGIGFRFPHLSAFVLPAGLYPQLNEKPVTTLAVTSVVVTATATDEKVAYDVAEQIYDQANAFSQIYPLAGITIQDELSKQRLLLPIHPGAVRFSQRNAPTLLERYAEIGALMLTTIVAATSASFATFRMRRQRKKDRIDDFYQQLLVHRSALSSDVRDAKRTRTEVRNLQNKVTQLVIDERIQADSAYVGFLSLSNQILEEAQNWEFVL